MKEPKAQLRVLLTTVSIIGLGILAYAIFEVSQSGWDFNKRWLPLVVLMVGLTYFGTVNIPTVKAQISVSDALIYICAFIFGIYPTIILSIIDALLQSIRVSKKWSSRIYNVGSMALCICFSVAVTKYFFPNAVGNVSLTFRAAELIAPLALMALLYFFSNTVLIASVLALRKGMSLPKVWLDGFLWTSISYFAGAGAAGVVCLLIKYWNFYVILIVAPIFLITYFTYKFYLDKVETTNKHLNELSSLYDQVSQAKAEWESTFNAMSDVILLFGTDGRLNRINDAGLMLEQSASLEALLHRPCCELNITCEDGVCRVKQVLITGKKYLGETDRYYGSFMVTGDPLVDNQGRLQGVVFILKDITEQRRLREQLVQSEKMGAVGQLVSGVAHELNNPLTSVIGYSELAQMDRQMGANTKKQLEIVAQEAMRACKIVQNLLTFARQHKPEKKLTHINSILERIVELRAYEMRVHSITVEVELTDLPEIMCDGPQLQQVFLNIIINAEQAMLEANGRGHLRLKTARVGERIVVSIEDNGPGIEAENLKKIFDPFFTTKEVGKGTGLGLSICYGIVQEHGGRLYAKSKPGEGSTFFIELPVIMSAVEPIVEKPVVVERAVSPKHILVVDDEEFIADIVRGVLEKEGHQVVTANSGQAALELLSREQYDLILTDVKMPELTGDALYEKIRAKDEHLARRMIFMTGDMINDETHDFLQRVGNQYIPKPFAVEELLSSVNSVMVNYPAA